MANLRSIRLSPLAANGLGEPRGQIAISRLLADVRLAGVRRIRLYTSYVAEKCVIIRRRAWGRKNSDGWRVRRPLPRRAYLGGLDGALGEQISSYGGAADVILLYVGGQGRGGVMQTADVEKYRQIDQAYVRSGICILRRRMPSLLYDFSLRSSTQSLPANTIAIAIRG